MSKKPKRGSPTIDMTAMVDVAFLLLTFFILTTTSFKEETAVAVDTPSSISPVEVPSEDLTTILVSDSGKVFIGFSDVPTRDSILRAVCQEKKIPLSDAGLAFFTGQSNFGVPLGGLSAWLDMEATEREEFVQSGIPMIEDDSLKLENELRLWIKQARLYGIKKARLQGEGNKERMQFALKGDGNAKYPAFNAVLKSLQYWKINKLIMVTEMEDAPALDDI